MKVKLERVDSDFHFQGFGASEVAVNIDASSTIGGNDAGARPMELVLMGLGSCSAIDIIEILKKQRQDLQDIKIVIKAERAAQIPAVFKKIHVEYHLFGNLVSSKVERAVDLSFNKYCSVSVMLAKTAKLEYSYKLNL